MDGLAITNSSLLGDVWKILEPPDSHHSVLTRERRIVDTRQVISDKLRCRRIGRPTSKIFLGQVADPLNEALRPFERDAFVRQQIAVSV